MSRTMRRIVHAYDNPLARAYCRARFWIMRERLLQEIGQYLPEAGLVLDVGCGFGLFSLYFGASAPERRVRGIDLDARRVATARRAAARLGLDNVAYEARDVRAMVAGGVADGAYMIDLVHHLPPDRVGPLLVTLARSLPAGAPLVVKDIAPWPATKRWFTWLLDKAMAPRTPVQYWSPVALTATLEAAGFGVHRHVMADRLPYPHVLYVCQRRAAAPARVLRIAATGEAPLGISASVAA